MKNHGLSCLDADRLRKPFHIHHRLRRKARHSPRDGREVIPLAPPDFAEVIAAAPLVATWNPSPGICVAPAFEAAGL
jgi:hypothetical protein